MFWKKLLLTGLYTGYLPKGSGTFGALLALFIYVAVHKVWDGYGTAIIAVLVAVILYPAIKLGDEAEMYFGQKDPQEVVLDEMVGYWVTMVFHPFSIMSIVLGFFFFRLYDILKPYPINKLQYLRGGAGIMMDDVIAGMYANITMTVIIVLLKSYGIMLV